GCFDHEQAVAGRFRTHGFAGIDDQIEQHLLKLNRIAANRGEAVGKTSAHRDILENQVAARERQDVRDQLVDSYGLHQSLTLLEERTKVIDDISGTPVVLHDVLKNLLDLFVISRPAGEKPGSGLSVAQNCSERLIEFVCKGA